MLYAHSINADITTHHLNANINTAGTTDINTASVAAREDTATIDTNISATHNTNAGDLNASLRATSIHTPMQLASLRI